MTLRNMFSVVAVVSPAWIEWEREALDSLAISMMDKWNIKMIIIRAL